MGTQMGPSYANLFVGFIKRQFFSQYHGPKPELYGRYIDIQLLNIPGKFPTLLWLF